MKINLRKASALQLEIKSLISKNNPDPRIEINEYEDFQDQISKAVETYEKKFSKCSDLTVVLYEIRKKVSVANHVSGINDVLADIAMLSQQIHLQDALATYGEREPDNVISGRIEKIKASENDYYRQETVSATVFSKEKFEQLTDITSHMKRERKELQDKLLELNVSNTIVLSETAVSVLKSEYLI